MRFIHGQLHKRRVGEFSASSVAADRAHCAFWRRLVAVAVTNSGELHQPLSSSVARLIALAP